MKPAWFSLSSLRAHRWVRLLGLMAGAGLAALPAAEKTRVFRAGADRSDITPDLGILIVGNTNPVPARHVHDPLSVRTLVLDDGETRLAFVLCDNVGVPEPVILEAKRQVTEQSGLPKSHVVIAATHSHSAGTARAIAGSDLELRDGFTHPPETLTPYQRFMARRVADSVQNAINRLEPARIGWGSGSEPGQVFNRRWLVKSEDLRRSRFGGLDTARMNPPAGSPELIRPAGPTDPEIGFLVVKALDGRPLALLANYSLHYVGGIPADTISADYFGVFAERIGELLGTRGQDPAFVGIMSNGTSGDINNIDFRQRRQARAPYEQMHRVANIVAAEVYRVYQTVDYHDWVKLEVRYEELPLQPRRATPEMVAWAREILARPPGSPVWHPGEVGAARWVLRSLDAPRELRVPVQAFRVGALGIAVSPAETLVEIGLEIKAKSPFAQTFTISIANGAYGYLPTVEQHKLGGYETWLGVNRLEIEAAPKMVTALLRMLESMR